MKTIDGLIGSPTLMLRVPYSPPERGEVGRGAILRSIWKVQEHYPEWSQIIVTGADTTNELSDDPRDDGNVIVTKRGFTLFRA